VVNQEPQFEKKNKKYAFRADKKCKHCTLCRWLYIIIVMYYRGIFE